MDYGKLEERMAAARERASECSDAKLEEYRAEKRAKERELADRYRKLSNELTAHRFREACAAERRFDAEVKQDQQLDKAAEMKAVFGPSEQ